ncbi:MAG: hypothetical protein COS49_00735 [Candidatus Portnoybacteria bacterium CG03_land_8_20_14_0_80_41_10]|uniref:DOD-type homing endonuclease domain-containing protein n=1 Tax=Candidatus Portnoybacteria bacterium CG03_land_8_20_14_0_80_41_10 TaxID=1974808 RepID=A0A2M7BV07_9BACT|nr:MAG: hypothetical protein COS49_00735 [Candidatus Portnoybacteria bacterium CG03_land_8_20_14_0_80_41_10]
MRGSQKNKNYVIKWTSKFAYAIGLFTADGSLSIDGRHLNFTSKDKVQVRNFMKCLGLKNRISKKTRGAEKIRKYHQVQFGNVKLYGFLQSIGLSVNKSLTIKHVEIPRELFQDFLRGLLDGDGNISILSHPESRYPQLRVRFASGSITFLQWLQESINKNLKLGNRGSIQCYGRSKCLSYGKEDSIKIFRYIYYSDQIICLKRKLAKAKPFLS